MSQCPKPSVMFCKTVVALINEIKIIADFHKNVRIYHIKMQLKFNSIIFYTTKCVHHISAIQLSPAQKHGNFSLHKHQ